MFGRFGIAAATAGGEMHIRILKQWRPCGRVPLGLLAAILGLCLGLLPAAPAGAANPAPVNPVSALLSPNGGLLEVQESAPVSTRDGVSTLTFVIPGDAENLQLNVPGQTIARWSSAPQPLERSGETARQRDDLLNESARLTGRLIAVKAQIALWQSKPENSVFQDLIQREKHMQEAIPPLSVEKADLERRIAVLQQELERLPMSPELGQMITVTLQKAVSGVSKLPIRYSYTLQNCGWQPVYSFDAKPDTGKGDTITVRLMAEVWQFTGMDWRDTRLTLASHGMGPREPAALPRWVVDSQAKPAPVPRSLRAAPKAAMLSLEDAAVGEAAPNAPVALDVSKVYATWSLAARGLPEGRSRLLIAADVWKAPLQWLARPVRGDSRVWLMAKYILPSGQAWPNGQAEFLVDGQSVGQGLFTPRGDTATLYFGADPRVSVTTTADSKRRGESGFIDKSRNWTWAWTYTLTNAHNRAVTVRLERPMPMIVDQGVTVSYDDTPPAQKDEKEHMLFWNVQVPASGKAEVRHGLTISSPKELPLVPDAP